MSRENHPIKSGTGTATVVAIFTSQVSPDFRKTELFLYIVSIIPPFLVWGQNWFWTSGTAFLATLPAKYERWKVKRDIKIAINDPLIQPSHKSELTEEYSRTETENLKQRITELRKKL